VAMVPYKFKPGDWVFVNGPYDSEIGYGVVLGRVQKMVSEGTGLYAAYNVAINGGATLRDVPERLLSTPEEHLKEAQKELRGLKEESPAAAELEPFVYPDEETGIEFSGHIGTDTMVTVRVPAAPRSKSYMVVELPLRVVVEFALHVLVEVWGFEAALKRLLEIRADQLFEKRGIDGSPRCPTCGGRRVVPESFGPGSMVSKEVIPCPTCSPRKEGIDD
jgi:hypothetical protein